MRPLFQCCVRLGTSLAFYEAIAGHESPPPTPLWTRNIFIFIHFVSTNRSSFAQQFRHSAGASPGALAHLKSGIIRCLMKLMSQDLAFTDQERARDDCLSFKPLQCQVSISHKYQYQHNGLLFKDGVLVFIALDANKNL